MGSDSLIPAEAAAGEAKEGGRIQLDDVRRGSPGVAAALADAQLDGGERRHAQLDRPTRVAEREEPTHGPRPVGQLRAGELGRRVVGECTDGGAQRSYIVC